MQERLPIRIRRTLSRLIRDSIRGPMAMTSRDLLPFLSSWGRNIVAALAIITIISIVYAVASAVNRVLEDLRGSLSTTVESLVFESLEAVGIERPATTLGQLELYDYSITLSGMVGEPRLRTGDVQRSYPIFRDRELSIRTVPPSGSTIILSVGPTTNILLDPVLGTHLSIRPERPVGHGTAVDFEVLDDGGYTAHVFTKSLCLSQGSQAV